GTPCRSSVCVALLPKGPPIAGSSRGRARRPAAGAWRGQAVRVAPATAPPDYMPPSRPFGARRRSPVYPAQGAAPRVRARTIQVARAGAARRWTRHRACGKAGASLESVVTNPEIRSATQGRLRIRWGALAHGSTSPEAVRDRLGRVAGVLDLDVYPRAGSRV